MKVMRHFFISGDLDDLERLEEDLERAGFATAQIHLLTLDVRSASHHRHLHQVSELMKLNLVRWGIIGAAIGLCASVLVLGVAHYAGWTQTTAGWLPFIFLAVIAFGFSTWEGGFLGIQTPNVRFKRFEKALEAGKHVFFVDLEPAQAEILTHCVINHPTVEAAGTGPAAPHWIVFWQRRLNLLFTETSRGRPLRGTDAIGLQGPSRARKV